MFRQVLFGNVAFGAMAAVAVATATIAFTTGAHAATVLNCVIDNRIDRRPNNNDWVNHGHAVTPVAQRIVVDNHLVSFDQWYMPITKFDQSRKLLSAHLSVPQHKLVLTLWGATQKFVLSKEYPDGTVSAMSGSCQTARP